MGKQSGKVFQFVWSTAIDRGLWWQQQKSGHESQTCQPKRIFAKRLRNFLSTSNIYLVLSQMRNSCRYYLTLYLHVWGGCWVKCAGVWLSSQHFQWILPSTFIFRLQRSKAANGKTDIKWQFTGDHFAQRVIVSYRDMYGRTRTNGTFKPVDYVPHHSPPTKLIFRTPHMKIVWRGGNGQASHTLWAKVSFNANPYLQGSANTRICQSTPLLQNILFILQ